MNTIERYAKPSSLREALALKEGHPEAAWLAGGTDLLAGDARDKPAFVIDIRSVVPRAVESNGETTTIGAGLTFQELLESKAVPGLLAQAARGMTNRNIRDRATVGGNLGAGRSCSSLLPALLVLDARVIIARNGSQDRLGIEAWPNGAKGLIIAIELPIDEKRLSACGRWARTACDLSILNAAVSYKASNGCLSGLRIAMGGMAPRARRFPELERLFEGRPCPTREEIERAAAPCLDPIDDLRGSAGFKRLRGAALLADLVIGARADDSVRVDRQEDRP